VSTWVSTSTPVSSTPTTPSTPPAALPDLSGFIAHSLERGEEIKHALEHILQSEPNHPDKHTIEGQLHTRMCFVEDGADLAVDNLLPIMAGLAVQSDKN